MRVGLTSPPPTLFWLTRNSKEEREGRSRIEGLGVVEGGGYDSMPMNNGGRGYGGEVLHPRDGLCG